MKFGGIGRNFVLKPHSRHPNAHSKDNQSVKKHFALSCAPWCKGVFPCPEPFCASREPFTSLKALSYVLPSPQINCHPGETKAETAVHTYDAFTLTERSNGARRRGEYRKKA